MSDSKGAAVVYGTYDDGATWVERQTLRAADGAAGDQFGWAVAVHDSTIVVGAWQDDNEKGSDAGEYDLYGV